MPRPRSPRADALELAAARDFSDETAHLVDLEVERLLGEQRDRARLVLGGHLAALEAMAQALIERETLSGEEVARIIETHSCARPSAIGRSAPLPAHVPVAAACTVETG